MSRIVYMSIPVDVLSRRPISYVVCMSIMYTDTKFHKSSCNCPSLISVQPETEIISHGGLVVIHILLNC
jgi:hypothetical protein